MNYETNGKLDLSGELNEKVELFSEFNRSGLHQI